MRKKLFIKNNIKNFRVFQILLNIVFFSVSLNAQTVTDILNNMSYEEKAAQVLMVSVGDKIEFPAYSFTHFDGIVPGAILLFKMNIADSPKKVHHFIHSCKNGFKQIAKNSNYEFIPPVFALDNEGGRVYRTKALTSQIPSAMEIATNLNTKQAEKLYSLLGIQMRQMGISLNLAPVCETAHGGFSILGDRVFSSNSNVVIDYSMAFIRGMKKSNVISTAKHFPGNGNEDLHTSASTIACNYTKFITEYVQPFKSIVKEADFVMASHVTVPCVEAKPFCFSKKGLNILKKDLSFSGVVLTDDLVMKALNQDNDSIYNIAINALDTGCDMLMYSGRDVQLIVEKIAEKAKLDKNFALRLNNAVSRILNIKLKYGIIGQNSGVVKNQIFNESLFLNAKQKANSMLNEN